MHPNDVQLIRVYARERKGKIVDKTFPSDAEFELVVEAEAGKSIHGGGAKFSIHIVVRDLTDFTIIKEDQLQGLFSEENWPKPVLSHTFPIPTQGPKKENHIYEILASLSVGVRNPNVSFERSPLFIIHQP